MPSPEIEARIKQLLASPNVSEEKKRALQAQLDAYNAKQAARVAPAAPAPSPGEALGGGPGGMSGGGGASAPGADPYVQSHAAEEAERLANDPTATPRPMPSPLERAGGGMVSALAGLDSTVTGGLIGALARRMSPEAGEVVDMSREMFPAENVAGRVGGVFVPGVGKLVGTTSASMAGLKAGQGLLETLVRGAVASAVGGGTQGAIEASVAGQDTAEGAQRGLEWGALLGPLASGLGYAGNKMAQRLRDPRTPQGRDLQLAEKGGATTSTLSGLKPGPQVAELAEQGTKLGGVSPESIAAERAAPALGKELQTQTGRTLSSIKMQNEALYESGAETSLRPLLKKQLGILRDATHDGVLLPGQNVDEVVRSVNATASPKVVPRTSIEAHGAEADELMDVGLARHLGIVKGGPTAADAESVVVFTPRTVDARAIDTTARALDARANVKSGNYDPAKVPAKKMGAAVREAREGLGPEVAEAKAAQSASLTRMKNQLEASGLPRETEAVDLGDFGTMDALYRAVRRYRTEGNLVADRELDKLAAGNPGLRELLDTYAGTAATQRLRGQADLEFSASGNIRPHGLTGAAKLHLDPLMQWLGRSSMTPVPGLSTTAAEQRRSGR
jgi:hypothetical protein